jgi:hypothetical protein
MYGRQKPVNLVQSVRFVRSVKSVDRGVSKVVLGRVCERELKRL